MLPMCLLCVAVLRASVTNRYTSENPQLNIHGHQWNQKMSGNHISRKGECRCASTFTAYAYISTFTVLRYFNWCEVEVTFCQKVTWKQKDRHNLGEICVERSSNHLGRQGKERSPPWKSLMSNWKSLKLTTESFEAALAKVPSAHSPVVMQFTKKAPIKCIYVHIKQCCSVPAEDQGRAEVWGSKLGYTHVVHRMQKNSSKKF